MLTAQLRNQDPLQPLDSTQFIAQLASFSTVEQLVGVNDRLDAQADRVAADNSAGYASWIGHAASAIDGRFTASGGPEEFSVARIAGTERIEAVVMAEDGGELDRFTVAADAAGLASWAGATALGIAPGSELRIELVYHGSAGVIDRLPAAVFRIITGLRGTADGPVFDWPAAEPCRPAMSASFAAPAPCPGPARPDFPDHNAAPPARCLIPEFDGAIFSQEWKEALWARYSTDAPRPRTPSELQYSDRKLRPRS